MYLQPVSIAIGHHIQRHQIDYFHIHCQYGYLIQHIRWEFTAGRVGVYEQDMTIQQSLHIRTCTVNVYEVGKLLTHYGKFLDNIISFFYIVYLFVQCPFDDDFIRNNFIIQLHDFSMNVDDFSCSDRQLNIAYHIYLSSTRTYNMLHFDTLFVLGNCLHCFISLLQSDWSLSL